jgi:peroxiredoxin
VTLLTIFKSSCPTCWWALPFVERIHGQAVKNFQVLGIAEDTEEDAKALASELRLTFPIAIEQEPYPVSAAFGLTTVPTQFLIDASERILLASPGFSKEDFLEIARRAAELEGVEAIDPFPQGEKIPALRPG